MEVNPLTKISTTLMIYLILHLVLMISSEISSESGSSSKKIIYSGEGCNSNKLILVVPHQVCPRIGNFPTPGDCTVFYRCYRGRGPMMPIIEYCAMGYNFIGGVCVPNSNKTECPQYNCVPIDSDQTQPNENTGNNQDENIQSTTSANKAIEENKFPHDTSNSHLQSNNVQNSAEDKDNDGIPSLSTTSKPMSISTSASQSMTEHENISNDHSHHHHNSGGSSGKENAHTPNIIYTPVAIPYETTSTQPKSNHADQHQTTAHPRDIRKTMEPTNPNEVKVTEIDGNDIMTTKTTETILSTSTAKKPNHELFQSSESSNSAGTKFNGIYSQKNIIVFSIQLVYLHFYRYIST